MALKQSDLIIHQTLKIWRWIYFKSTLSLKDNGIVYVCKLTKTLTEMWVFLFLFLSLDGKRLKKKRVWSANLQKKNITLNHIIHTQLKKKILKIAISPDEKWAPTTSSKDKINYFALNFLIWFLFCFSPLLSHFDFLFIALTCI